MPGKSAFQVEGIVIDALPNRTYRVALANGHRLVGFVSGKRASSQHCFAAGDRVKLDLTPYDLSSGRIIIETNKSLT